MEYIQLENEMARYLHLAHKSSLREYNNTDVFEFSMWASPTYWIKENEGGMSCDTFTWQIVRSRAGDSVARVIIKKLEGRFIENSKGISMIDVSWMTIQEMDPEFYQGEINIKSCYPSIPIRKYGNSEEILAIRNLQNKFFEHRLHGVDILFSISDGATLNIENVTDGTVHGRDAIRQEVNRIINSERLNNHCYKFLGISGAPIIEINEDGNSARGIFTVQMYRIDAEDKNKSNWTLHRQLCVLESTYIKENGAWKILTMTISSIVELPINQYRNDLRYDKCGQSDEPWSVDQVDDSRINIKTAMEIENIINGWVYGCRRGELPEYVSRYFDHQGNVRMLIRSFGNKTPVLENIEAIREKTNGMTALYKNRFYTFHAPTTPVIAFDNDENHVVGTWFDCGTTNLGEKQNSPGQVDYMIFVNKYVHRFVKIEGKWYIEDFYAEPMIAMPDWHLNMLTSSGYVSIPNTDAYPDKFNLA